MDQVRIIFVNLNDITAIPRNLLDLPSQEYALALRTVHRLDDESIVLLALHVVHQVVRLIRIDPSLREEVEFLRELRLHQLQVLG